MLLKGSVSLLNETYISTRVLYIFINLIHDFYTAEAYNRKENRVHQNNACIPTLQFCCFLNITVEVHRISFSPIEKHEALSRRRNEKTLFANSIQITKRKKLRRNETTAYIQQYIMFHRKRKWEILRSDIRYRLLTNCYFYYYTGKLCFLVSPLL